MLITGFQAVAGGLLVECRESNGTSHLEFGGCGKDEAGRCAKPSGPLQPGEPEPGDPDPCEDRPVKSDMGLTTPTAAPSPTAFGLPLSTFAIITFSTGPPPQIVLARWRELRAAAPPPAIASIRTIVMLV